jgi:uncharacterized phiE125 gp8 family phage protein
MYALRPATVVEEPQPIDMAVVKQHLKRFDNSDDTYIYGLMIAAMESAEVATHRQIISAEWELILDRFPTGLEPIKLPRPPWRATNYVKYYDTSGVLTTWDSANYETAGFKEPAEITPAYGKVWPPARVKPGAVVVGFANGYGDGFASVPTLLKHGMLMLIGHWYMYRETVVVGSQPYELPMSVKDIFEQCSVGDDFDDYDPLVLCE